MQVSRETGGAYDITAGPLWEPGVSPAAQGDIPEQERLDEARSARRRPAGGTGRRRRTVRFLKPGVRLNLGSVGKGYRRRSLRRDAPEARHRRLSSSTAEKQRPGPRLADADPADFVRRGPPGGSSVFATRSARNRGSPTAAVQSGVGHVGGPVPVVSPSWKAVRAHSRSADRLARRGRLVGHGDRPFRRSGGHPFDRLLCAGPRGGLGLLPATSGNRRGHSLSGGARRRAGSPFRRPGRQLNRLS